MADLRSEAQDESQRLIEASDGLGVEAPEHRTKQRGRVRRELIALTYPSRGKPASMWLMNRVGGLMTLLRY